MKRIYKILLLLTAFLVVITGCFVILAGPWPTYKSGFEDKSYYKEAITEIERNRERLSHSSNIGRFEAGWSSRSITPPTGTPMAGFGDRKGKLSTGVHDEIFVKALAVSDGTDTAVIVGADMLIIPENVAELVRARVSKQTPITANEILFNASHNHSGLGGFAPGFASKAFNGPYNPNIPVFLARAFTEAIVEAYRSLEPAKMAHGGLDAPEYIRNRTRRDAPVDSELSYMLVEQKDGDRCFVVSYSAHPTILGADNMQFTAEYPGFLVRRITERTGAEAIYLGGAVGSMSPRPPDGDNAFERCRAMGEALADKVLEATADVKPFKNKVDVASIGLPVQLPPFQLRLSKNWRVSKFLFPILGIDDDGWMHALRIGDIVLVGTPADYCGEISIDLKSRTQNRIDDLWVLSFNGDYVGYISPDRYYYDKDEKGGYGYERGVMSWIGPDQEAFTVSLIMHMIDALFPESNKNL
ncbi:MAG: neutral/alkaline non-lysosomal ceramidase N-terminal domain-containing protein [Planctomycetes bacterium]|nr:neutral/alkaline non-lysosomal ceramidase N-terminal domain-containing protein [Planctomycetota bacterium]MBL7145766.1 neutral/alkaline non-lysosomal ceramidase N-terminal domain-containing protein [Phycisphaerae bacterium]